MVQLHEELGGKYRPFVKANLLTNTAIVSCLGRIHERPPGKVGGSLGGPAARRRYGVDPQAGVCIPVAVNQFTNVKNCVACVDSCVCRATFHARFMLRKVQGMLHQDI